MSYPNFKKLLELVEPFIKKQDTVMRQAIPPVERLAMTLRYLGSGNSFSDLMFLFHVPDNTIHGIVTETCEAIYKVLRETYLKVPTTPAEWMAIANQFNERWNLPNCVGAIDGKHTEIDKPGPGSTLFNYKGYNSIILLAVVDAQYKFVYVVGAHSRAGDAAFFREFTFLERLENKSLGIPEPRPLPGRTDPVPFFIAGDDSFPLLLLKEVFDETVSV